MLQTVRKSRLVDPPSSEKKRRRPSRRRSCSFQKDKPSTPFACTDLFIGRHSRQDFTVSTKLMSLDLSRILLKCLLAARILSQGPLNSRTSLLNRIWTSSGIQSRMHRSTQLTACITASTKRIDQSTTPLFRRSLHLETIGYYTYVCLKAGRPYFES